MATHAPRTIFSTNPYEALAAVDESGSGLRRRHSAASGKSKKAVQRLDSGLEGVPAKTETEQDGGSDVKAAEEDDDHVDADDEQEEDDQERPSSSSVIDDTFGIESLDSQDDEAAKVVWERQLDANIPSVHVRTEHRPEPANAAESTVDAFLTAMTTPTTPPPVMRIMHFGFGVLVLTLLALSIYTWGETGNQYVWFLFGVNSLLWVAVTKLASAIGEDDYMVGEDKESDLGDAEEWERFLEERTSQESEKETLKRIAAMVAKQEQEDEGRKTPEEDRSGEVSFEEGVSDDDSDE